MPFLKIGNFKAPAIPQFQYFSSIPIREWGKGPTKKVIDFQSTGNFQSKKPENPKRPPQLH
jgi:hypothetical protein